MPPQIHVLLPTNWTNAKRGDFFEKFIASLLKTMGYKVATNVRFTGMEVDCLAENIDTKARMYVECKFLKDPYPADFISKMIGNAFEQEVDVAYLFSTAEPGKDAKGKIDEITRRGNRVGKNQDLQVAFVGPERLAELYLQVNHLPGYEVLLHLLPDEVKHSVGAVTLVVTPEEVLWAIEQKRAGVPEKALFVPVNNALGRVRNFDLVRSLVEEAKVWVGLELVNGLGVKAADGQFTKEIVVTTPSADKFEDYRPSRPEDFVGRSELVSEFFKFFVGVQAETTPTRIVALSGPSGYGKSSIVLYLSAKCNEPKWRNTFFLYPHYPCTFNHCYAAS